ncbi:hypothetical protein, partial [Burkholderia diffusa]|uniref:hypothetical protein n=1 Tax=Burkholderia diffusa TaxID=488732 RepID=UPI001C2EEBA0
FTSASGICASAPPTSSRVGLLISVSQAQRVLVCKDAELWFTWNGQAESPEAGIFTVSEK